MGDALGNRRIWKHVNSTVYTTRNLLEPILSLNKEIGAPTIILLRDYVKQHLRELCCPTAAIQRRVSYRQGRPTP